MIVYLCIFVYNSLKGNEICMIITSKDKSNYFVNVDAFSSIKKRSLRQKISTATACIVLIPFFFIVLVNLVGFRFDNPVSIVVSIILTFILMIQLYYFAKANVYQSDYKYLNSRAYLIIPFVVSLLIEAAFAIVATIKRNVIIENNSFFIDGSYFLVALPIGIVVWIIFFMIYMKMYGKTLANISRRSFDDIPEKRFYEKFMNVDAIRDVRDTKECAKTNSYFIFSVAFLLVGSLIIQVYVKEDKLIYNYVNIAFLVLGVLFAIGFIVRAIKYKFFKNNGFIALLYLPFLLLVILRNGQLIWGRVIFSHNGEEWGELNTMLFIFVFVPGLIASSIFAYKSCLAGIGENAFLGTDEEKQEFYKKEQEITKKIKNPEDY